VKRLPHSGQRGSFSPRRSYPQSGQARDSSSVRGGATDSDTHGADIRWIMANDDKIGQEKALIDVSKSVRLIFLLCALSGWARAQTNPSTQPARRGLFNTTFTESSPLARKAESNKRFHW